MLSVPEKRKGYGMKKVIHFSIIAVILVFVASQVTESYAGKKRSKVVKTGQTEIIEVGDDGDFQRGKRWPKPRFKDRGRGNIIDLLTNLVWDKRAARFGESTWLQALIDCNGLADNGGDLTDGSQAGDWRLPNLFELESLRHMGVYNPAVPDTLGTGQWSQGDPFNNVQSSFYWSSTTDAGGTSGAWNVDFGLGGVSDGNKAFSIHRHVWCVRGGP